MNNDKARIRLAEVMYETEDNSLVIGKNRELMWLTDAYGKALTETIRPIPDPFTNANDDYAVLEWMRSQIFSKRTACVKALAHELQKIEEDGILNVAWPDAAIRYQIGDYARAALKVLDTLEQSADRIQEPEE